jgi:hypothetical protein
VADVSEVCGYVIVYDALFNVMYRVEFSYLVMCYGDNVLGHICSVCPVHIVTYALSPQRKMCTSFNMFYKTNLLKTSSVRNM